MRRFSSYGPIDTDLYYYAPRQTGKTWGMQQVLFRQISREVIERIYDDCKGQPGLTCWLGELLTDRYNKDNTKPITMRQWEYTYMYASRGLPNNNILNIIEKAYKEALKQTAVYGKQLDLNEISLILFIDTIDEENRKKFEIDFTVESETGKITVKPVFVQVYN